LRDHVARSRLRAEERAFQVDVHGALPCGFVQVQGGHAGHEAGVVDPHVQRAVLGSHRVGQCAYRLRLRDVQLAAIRVHAGQRLKVQVGGDYGRALLAERRRHGASNTAPGPRDNRDFPCQIRIVHFAHVMMKKLEFS
jgi:hypothetical protein